jgi:hypothetical protein
LVVFSLSNIILVITLLDLDQRGMPQEQNN